MNDRLARLAGDRQLPKVLAGIAALALLVGIVTLAFRLGRSGDDDALPPAPGTVPGSPSTGAGPPDGEGGFPAPTGSTGIAASARSVAYEGDLVGLGGLRLRNSPSLDFAGEVIDGQGTPRGQGRLTAGGPELHVTGKDLVATLSGELRLTGAAARFTRDVNIAGSDRVTAAGTTFTFQPSAGGEAAAVPGPVTLVGKPAVAITISPTVGEIEWVDVPGTLRLAGKGRTTLSWAGQGVVRVDRRDHRAGFLGIKASAIDATIERGGPSMRIRGTATYLQVYADGLPKLGAKARVRLKSSPSLVSRGENGRFTWAPENDGKTDMVMTRIRPGNAEAGWVSLGLDKLPAMCGGEQCPVQGGDTSGFRRGRGINAVIIPDTGDERDISFRVPADAPLGRHRLLIVVEGNFEPIQVEFEFEVVAPTPTTTIR